MKFSKLKQLAVLMVLSVGALSVFADDAPVYDVDNYPPAFGGQRLDESFVPDNTGTKFSADGDITDNGFHARPEPVRTLTQEQRIALLEQKLKNMQQSNSFKRSQELQTEVQTLRGQVEELSHKLAKSESQQKTMYLDLDTRLQKFGGTKKADIEVTPSIKKPSVKTAAKKNNEAKINAATQDKIAKSDRLDIEEEQKIYQKAYDLIKAKKYSAAISTLKDMLDKYPSGQTAANAHYWLGELYGLVNQNDKSAKEFSTVIKQYPKSQKAPDAQLKLGLIYVSGLKWKEAKKEFKQVVKQYPGTSTARLATDQLKQISKAGH